MSCQHSGYELSTFCGKCGAHLTPMNCACGHSLLPDENFCSQCGKPAAVNNTAINLDDIDHRFDLNEMMRLNEECGQLPGTEKTHVSQRDIDELFRSNHE